MTQSGLFSDNPPPEEPEKSGSTDVVENGKTLTTFFVNAAREQNKVDPPRKIIGMMAKAIGESLRTNADTDLVKEAIERVVRDGISPSKFHEILWQVQVDAKGTKKEDRDAIRDFLAGHNGFWPTGARFVRGTHSGTYVFDPLGYDVLPRGYDHGGTIRSPTRQDVLTAIRGVEPASTP